MSESFEVVYDHQPNPEIACRTKQATATSPTGKRMSDNLRDRIACVLAGITPNNTPKPQYVEMADEVMVEVKKELANEYNKGWGDGHEEGWCEGWDANE